MNTLAAGVRPAKMARTNPDIDAASKFIAAGGRLMISPRGRFLTAIDLGLIFMTGEENDARRECARAFRRAALRPGATKRLRSLVVAEGKAVSGWLVLEAL